MSRTNADFRFQFDPQPPDPARDAAIQRDIAELAAQRNQSYFNFGFRSDLGAFGGALDYLDRYAGATAQMLADFGVDTGLDLNWVKNEIFNFPTRQGDIIQGGPMDIGRDGTLTPNTDSGLSDRLANVPRAMIEGRHVLQRIVMNNTLAAVGYDPYFRLTEDILRREAVDRSGELLPPESFSKFSEATSLSHLRVLVERERQDAEASRRLQSNFGTVGSIAVGFVVSQADPINALAGFAGGAVEDVARGALLARGLTKVGLAAETGQIVSRATRLSMLAKSGVIGAGTGAGVNVATGLGLASLAGRDYSLQDAILDTTIGATFGSFQGLSESGTTLMAASTIRRMVAEEGLVTLPKGEFFFDQVPGHRPDATVEELRIADIRASINRLADANPGNEIEALRDMGWLKDRKITLEDGSTVEITKVNGAGFVEINGVKTSREITLEAVDSTGTRHTVTLDSVRPFFTEQTPSPVAGADVRLSDGKIGTIDSIDNGIATVKVGDATSTVPLSELAYQQGPALRLKGETSFDEVGRATVALLKSKDVSTAIHESGHVFRGTLRDIDANLADELNALYGEVGDRWSVQGEERFARAFEKYVADGKAPNSTLQKVFDTLSGWIRSVYARVKGSPLRTELTGTEESAFARLLDGKPEGDLVGGPGTNYERVSGQLRQILGKQADQILPLIEANASAWSRAKGKNIDLYFRDVLENVTETRAGAVRTLQQTELPAYAFDFDFAGASDQKASFTPARIGIAARFGADASAWIRRVGNMLVEDALIKKDGSSQGSEPASAGVIRRTRSALTQRSRDIEPLFELWSKARGDSAWLSNDLRVKAHDEFQKAITLEVRNPGKTNDKIVASAAKLQRQHWDEFYNYAADNLIPGFERGAALKDYAPRIYDRALIHEAIAKHGRDKVLDVFELGISNMQAGLAPGVARRVADGMLEDIMDLKSSVLSHDRGTFDGETLAAILKDRGIAQADIDAVVGKVVGQANANSAESRTISRGKRRVFLDESADTGTIKLSDLLENNAEKLSEHYARSIFGEAAMQAVYRELDPTGQKINSADGLLKRAKEEMRKTNAGDQSIRNQLTRLDFAIKSIKGIPIEDPNSDWVSGLRRTRDLNFLTRGGGFGMAAAMEMAVIPARAGFRATIAQIPAMGDMLRAIRRGEGVSDEYISFLQGMAGLGDNRITRAVMVEQSSRESASLPTGTRIGAKYDRIAGNVRNVFSDMTGITPLTDFSTLLAGNALIDKFQRIAESGDRPSNARLSDYNLNRAQWDEIAKELRAHGNAAERKLGIENWTNLQARADFVQAISRKSRQIIHEGDIGLNPYWMNTTAGKTAIQFRTFAVGAWEKQFLSNLAVLRSSGGRDMEAFSSWFAMSVAGLGGYMATVYLNSIGRDDRQEYLADRLSEENIVRAIVSRAAFTSLIPSLYDSAAAPSGLPTIMPMRFSGLESDPILGNPTFALYMEAKGLPFRMIRSALDSGYDFSKQDLRALRALIPLQNMPGITNMFNLFNNNLPQSSTEGQ